MDNVGLYFVCKYIFVRNSIFLAFSKGAEVERREWRPENKIKLNFRKFFGTRKNTKGNSSVFAKLIFYWGVDILFTYFDPMNSQYTPILSVKS